MTIKRTTAAPSPLPANAPAPDKAPAKAAVPPPAPASKGWGPKLHVPVVEAALSAISAKLDAALPMFDTRGPKPVTLTGVTDADFSKMEAKVAQLEAGARPLSAQDQASLEKGKILSESRPRPDGLVEERTIGIVDLPLEKFLQKVPAKDWGKHLADYKGGEVKPAGPGKQIERMVLGAPGKDLDMTKVETIKEERDASGRLTGAHVRWEVLKSDNGSVVQDVGSLRFERDGDRTRVTWHSAHQPDIAPLNSPLLPKAAKDALTGVSLSGYFARAIAAYRAP